MTKGNEWKAAARGVATSFATEPEGQLFEINSATDALDLIDEINAGRVKAPIVLIHEAGGTTVGPLLEDAGGVVSTKGTLGAHVALLAKEYGCPCIVGAEWTIESSGADRARLATDGTVWVTEKAGE